MMIALPPVPYTPPMYRAADPAKRARVWYAQDAETARKVAAIWDAAAKRAQAVKGGAEEDPEYFTEACLDVLCLMVVALEVGTVTHEWATDTDKRVSLATLPPRFLSECAQGLVLGGYDSSYPK